MEPPERVSRRELGFVAGGMAALVLLFFAGSGVFAGRIFSPADVLYAHAPWSDQPSPAWTHPANPLTGEDSAFVFEPWLQYSAARLHAGALPLWNPDSLLGVPLIGNMQSAVFSPLNWPFFLWPDPWMLVVAPALKIWLALLGMYMLAREVLRGAPLPAVLAVTTFAFGAFMSMWLVYPLSSAAAWLPWLLWATARLVEAPGPRPFARLAAIVGLNLVAGHPETAYHAAQATGVFALFYTWRVGAVGWRPWAVRLGAVAGAYGLGAGLAAVQLLPFLDYLRQSAMLLTRGNWGSPILPDRGLLTLISPTLFGSPATGNWWDPTTTYQEITAYGGLLPLLLAPFALLARKPGQRGLAALFIVLALVSLGVVYRWPGVFDVAMLLPGMAAVANQRLLLVVQLAFALVGAIGLDALLAQTGSRRPAVRLLGAVGLLGALAVGVPWLLGAGAFGVPGEAAAALTAWEDGLQRSATLLAVEGGALALALAWLYRSPHMAGVVSVILIVIHAGDLVSAFGSYNPTVARTEYYPPTPATTFLQARQQAEGPLRVVAMRRAFPPNASLVYGLADPRGYDALEPQPFHELAAAIEPAIRLKPGGSPTVYRSVRSPLINLLNVRYVLAGPDEDPNYLLDARQEAVAGSLHMALTPGARPGQTFTANQDHLAAIQVFGSTAGGQARGALVFHLMTDAAAPADLVTLRLDLTDLPDGGYWWLRFPPIPDSAGRSFYFYCEVSDVGPAPPLGLAYSPNDAYAPGTRTDSGAPAPGDLLFRALTLPDADATWFSRVLDGGATRSSVFANRRALPRAWLAHRLEVQPDPATRVARLADPAFNALSTVLLAAPLPAQAPLPTVPPNPAADQVTITRYEHEAVAITTNSAAAGVLVLADQAFSGWTATVDGAPTPILTADHALRAVALPSGTHTVRFAYEPLAFTAGAAVSAGTLLVLLALAASHGRRRRAQE
ncbi:MAG TPA: YfhO family protein [Chloroflexia bacterium]|nr:YfhO family protein [Chloroflexia bacterium]